MTRKTKRILGGVVGTISVLAVVLLLANKLLNQPQRIAYLPANYDRQDTAHEIPPTSPITTEKQDKCNARDTELVPAHAFHAERSRRGCSKVDWIVIPNMDKDSAVFWKSCFAE